MKARSPELTQVPCAFFLSDDYMDAALSLVDENESTATTPPPFEVRRRERVFVVTVPQLSRVESMVTLGGVSIDP